jgi:putative tricarboxylic transport membrane protein
MARLSLVIAPLAGLVISIGLLFNTRGLDEVARGDQLGPGFWPRLVLAGLGLTCLAKLVVDWRASVSTMTATESVTVPDDRPTISRAKLGVGVALILFYVALAPLVGFPLATAAFIAGFIRLCGGRSPVMVGANAVVGTVLLLYIFVKLVYLPLPKGEGLFETATLALYRALRLF